MRRLIAVLLLFVASAVAQTFTLTPTVTIDPPSVTTGWTAEQGTWSVSSGNFINSSAPGNMNPFVYTSWSGGTTGQYIQVKFYGFSISPQNGPGILNAGNTTSGYSAYCSTYSSPNCTVWKLQSGTTPLATITTTVAPGGKVGVAKIGNVVYLLNNGVVAGSATDTTYSTGSPFLRTYNTFTSAYGIEYVEMGTAAFPIYGTDNFSGDTVGAFPAGWSGTAASNSGFVVVAGGIQPSGNAVSSPSGSSATMGYNYVAASAGNQTSSVYAHWAALLTYVDSIGVCTNIQAGGNTSYCLTCRGTYGTGECNVVKAVNGSQSTLCTGVLYALTPTNGMLYSLQSVGTSTVVLTPTINGTAVPGLASTCTDSSSPLTGGQPGVTVGVGPTSSTANTYLYGFSGGVPPVSATHRSFGMVF